MKMKYLFFPLLLLAFVSMPMDVSAAQAASESIETQKIEPTIEEMLGCLLMLGFRGDKLDSADSFLALVKEGKIRNFILFDRDVTDKSARNIISPAQLKTLTASLRNSAPGPILIAVDQEGGQVRRLRPQKGFLDLPSHQSLGQGNQTATFETADALGKELHDLGINVDLAPVVDVDTNPFNPAIGRLGRSFSPDPSQVALHALAFGRGLAKNGVIPCLKHFPGQGCATEDSHLGLSDITQCWDPEIDLAPYAEIFKAGWPGMVMTGHLFHTGLDSTTAATLSKKIITGLLREGLGWQGVVISDDLQMKAIAQDRDLAEIFTQALNAGVDMLLLGNNLEWDSTLPQRAWDALHTVVENGMVARERIKESWVRIMALQEAYNIK